MPVVTIKGLGLAERQIAHLILSGLTVADRTTAMMTKTIRRQLKLRELRMLTDELTREKQDEMISKLGENPDQNIVANIQRMVGVGWDELTEEGYNNPDNPDEYGYEYRVDRTALQWLSGKRDEREVWEWTVNDGKREPARLASEMLEAIATFDECVADALGEKLELEPDD